MNRTHSFRVISCGLDEQASAIYAKITGFTESTSVSDIQKINQVAGIIGTLGVRCHEKLVFDPIEVIERKKKTSHIVLPFKKMVLPFEELPFTLLSHCSDEFQKELTGIERTEAAFVGARYAVEREHPAVKVIFFKQNSQEGVLRVLNYNLYKKISPADTKRIEKFIGTTGCLLMK